MKRGRGRPPKTEHEQMGQVLWFERLLEEEITALLRQGHKPKKALARAASRLEISKRSAHRLMAEIKRQNERLAVSIASFGALWRQLERDREEKNSGTDFLAQNSGSAD